jgi:hypothetical protein
MGIDPNLRWEADSSTRYLCVGAEIDSDFAHEVIEAVLEERYQAVAPSFGIDLVPVVRHALNGRRRRTTRDLTVAALAAVNLLLNPVGSVATVVAWLVTRFFYRRARLRWPQWGTRNALAVGAIAYATIGALLALMVVLPAAALGVAAGTSSPGLARLLTSLLRIASIGSVLSLLAVWGVVLWERLATRSVLVDTLRWDTYDPARRSVRVDLDPRAQQRLQVIDEVQRRHNVTAYSGFFPFLGAGGELRTWSFGIDLTRGTPGFAMDGQRPDGQQPPPFTIAELQAHVAQRLEALRSPDLDPAHRLGGLIVEDRLFIHGTHVWRDGRFLPDAWRPPLAWVEPAVLARIGDEPGGVVRHFKCARVESWGREVVLSVFLHFATDGRTLYVEQTACLLPPIKTSYRIVDGMTRSLSTEELYGVLWATLKEVPAALLRAPGELWRAWRSKRRERKQDNRLRAAIAEGLPVDYGARVSVRELGAADSCRIWFQQLDAAKHQKVIELQVLNAILDFLERHDVDTTEFRSRQASILNNNTVLVNGDMKDSQVAVGTAATATGTPTPAAAGGPSKR